MRTSREATDAMWTMTQGPGPIVAVAIHDGHAVRREVEAWLRLSEAERLREEDPYTAGWTEVAATRVIATRSRFEVDLNRPREGAVYVAPEQSWGLRVWDGPLPLDLIARSLETWDGFYRDFGVVLEEKRERHGRFVVFDIHSYNHRRSGRDAAPANPCENPDVNLGTGSMDRARWSSIVDRFMADLRGHGGRGIELDVRENVRFRGGYLAQWVHEHFPATGCALAIEFKKTFMDEWTGEPDAARIEFIHGALASAAEGVLEELSRC